MSGTAAGPLDGGRIGYVFVTARDFGAMLTFYRDTLGLAVEHLEEQRCVFLRFANGGPRLAIYAGRADAGQTEPHWFLVVDVPDIERAVAALRARDVAVGGIEPVPHGRAAMFADPEGNRIEVHEPAVSQ